MQCRVILVLILLLACSQTSLQVLHQQFTFYLDSDIGSETNSTCLLNTVPCKKLNQVQESGILLLKQQRWNTSSILNSLEFNIIVKGSLTDCKVLFDFSNFTSTFNLKIISGEENDYFRMECTNLLDSSSKIDEMILERVFFYRTGMIIDNPMKKFQVIKSTGNFLVESNIENATFIENEMNFLQIYDTIQYLNIKNCQIYGLELSLKPKQVYIHNSQISSLPIKFSNFEVVEIVNSKWKSMTRTPFFSAGGRVSIISSTLEVAMMFEVLNTLEMSNVTVENTYLEPESGSFFGISTVDEVTFTNCNFYNNDITNMISVQRSAVLQFDQCNFFNNRATFLTILGTRSNTIRIENSNFMNNDINGAIIDYNSNFLVDSAILSITECNFVNNNGGANGSAIKVSKGSLSIDNSNFSNNTAMYGGAIYCTDQLMVTILNSNFTKNQATQSGGAIYIDGNILRKFDLENVRCDSNVALESGGCIYTKGKTASVVSYNNMIGRNKANHYGNNIATDLVKQKLEFRRKNADFEIINNQTIIQVFPGESLDFRLTLFDRFDQKPSSLQDSQMSLSISSQDLVLQRQGFTSGNESILSNNIQILLQNSETKQAEIISVKFKVKNLEQLINMKLIDCPSGYSLTTTSGNTKCERIPIEIIIPTVIVGSISLIIILVTILLIGIYILGKLRKLRRQEQAEKEIQKKFTENSFVFDTVNGNGNVNDLFVPLMDTISNSQDSYQYTIPIEEIKIESKLGEGSNGIVYKAKWNRTDIAIKQLKTSGDEDKEEFEREAILMSSLRHPSVVSCYGVSVTNSSKYMVVEYLENGTLERALYYSKMGRDKLSFQTKLKILIDVSNGMTYLHSIKPNRIIHRDLKPGNILLTKNMKAKVADFGLSKMVSNHTATMTTNVGTLLYIAPELLSNYHKGQTTKLDVYSFGIILWEVLFETTPFSNEISNDTTPFSILLQVTHGHRPSLYQLGDNFENVQEWIEEQFPKREIHRLGFVKITNCLKEYVQLMKACWDDNPNNRPEFMEVTESLEAILEVLVN